MTTSLRPAALAAAGLLAAGLTLPAAVSQITTEVVADAPGGGVTTTAPVVTKAVCVLMPVGDSRRLRHALLRAGR